jgi:hypothetical protein
MNGEEKQLRARNLRTLAALATLFLAPLLIAFCTYYGSAWRPLARVNHGELIEPPRPLPPGALPQLSPDGGAAAAPAPWHGKWTLVYVGGGDCGEECRASLILMRQTRLALNTDMTRVQRLFLVSSACCDRAFLAQQAGLSVLDASGPAGAALLQEFPAAQRGHTLFVVDPLGNLMMSYDARRNPRGLLEDLKKLLRLSQIG